MHRRVRALLTMRVLVLIAAGHAAAALAVIGYAGWGLWNPLSRRSDVGGLEAVRGRTCCPD